MSDQTTPQGAASETTTTAAPVLAVPLNADGTIGTLPEPLQKLFDQRLREGIARGRAKATPDPVAEQEVVDLRRKVEQFEQDDLARQKRYEEALQKERDRAAKNAEKLLAESSRRHDALKRQALERIKVEALKAGARDESLDELTELLGRRVDLNDDFELVAQGPDGQPLEGGITALVTSYLDAKPHHRRSTGGQSMQTVGGVAARTGHTGTTGTQATQAVLDRIQQRGYPTGQDLKDLAAARAGSRP